MREREAFGLAKKKNRERLSGSPYTIGEVFRPAEYDWPGDWEGRALLAFALHARMGEEIPCMRQMLDLLPEKTNGKGFFGAPFREERIDEQQLSGHNWYLRGLLACAENGETRALEFARQTVENLFLPALAHYGDYPVNRGRTEGGVSGNRAESRDGWLLSTDVGCAFIALDSLAEYYALTGDERVKAGFEKAAKRFVSFDFVGLKLQTHATLSATRGLLTFYEKTGEAAFLSEAERIFALYREKGMTLTYENFNWFGREDTWTEPCAVVDSLILALKLYRITGREEYKKSARRIYFNGLTFCQRGNGGAGPNSCVTERQPFLRVSMYEASFCCTMRYAEGLWYIFRNGELFDEQEEISEENGRFFLGDRLLVKDETGAFADKPVFLAGGEELILLPSLNDMDEDAAKKVVLRVFFDRVKN